MIPRLCRQAAGGLRGMSSYPAANLAMSDQQLAATVAGWRRAWSPGPLTPDEMEQFWEEGYVLKQLLSPEDLAPSIQAIELLVDRLAEMLLARGLISHTHPDEQFETRLIHIEKQCPNASVWLHKQPFDMPSAFQALWAHPKLLGCAEQLLGPEIAGHPVWNLRTKVPSFSQATVPWHQDTAYLSEECWSVLQPAAWIPLVDTDTTNGCLRLLKGGHHSGKTAVHTCCWGDTWYIELEPEVAEGTLGVSVLPEEQGGDLVTVPVPKGSVLLFNNLIPHQSLENHSDSVRWSFDLRWQQPSQPSGFEGKPPILMRDGKGLMAPSEEDWAAWAALNPFKLRGSSGTDSWEASEMDSVITGPWMALWEQTNTNRHTDAFDPSGFDPAKWSTRTMDSAAAAAIQRNTNRAH